MRKSIELFNVPLGMVATIAFPWVHRSGRMQIGVNQSEVDFSFMPPRNHSAERLYKEPQSGGRGVGKRWESLLLCGSVTKS